VLNDVNPAHALQFCFFKVYFNIILRNKPVINIVFYLIIVVNTITPELNRVTDISCKITLWTLNTNILVCKPAGHGRDWCSDCGVTVCHTIESGRYILMFHGKCCLCLQGCSQQLLLKRCYALNTGLGVSLSAVVPHRYLQLSRQIVPAFTPCFAAEKLGARTSFDFGP